MRIVAGKHRGLTLATPKDSRVRPTSDRVREALFNVLAHNDFGIGFAVEGAGNAGGPCDLGFLDPPYRKGLAELALASARDGKWFAEKALVVAEMAVNEAFAMPAGFLALDERTYGDTKVVFVTTAAK